jgi:uncharacterized protein YndB with AHSA1/START domain
MTRTSVIRPDPRLDLVLERIVDVPKRLVWLAWTKPEHIKQWFTPAPWKTVDCEIDLRPGGIFRTVMRSPDGQEFPNVGCYLEVVEGERLVWTDALEPGFRPTRRTTDNAAGGGVSAFTAVITLATHGKGTKYTALAMHRSEAERKSHEEMGFHDGWGKALDQLVELVGSMRTRMAPRRSRKPARKSR